MGPQKFYQVFENWGSCRIWLWLKTKGIAFFYFFFLIPTASHLIPYSKRLIQHTIRIGIMKDLEKKFSQKSCLQMLIL